MGVLPQVGVLPPPYSANLSNSPIIQIVPQETNLSCCSTNHISTVLAHDVVEIET